MTIGVICSDSEGLSNTILEYMAAGLPVVATEVGGNYELVDNKKTGLLVKPDDPQQLGEAISSLLESQQIAGKMGASGREALRDKFSIEKMAGEYRALYESLAHPRSP
jgi:L-malate glycosyltransferase